MFFLNVANNEISYISNPGTTKLKRSGIFESSSGLEAGEWNVYEITCSGGGVELVVNGVLQNVGSDAAYSAGQIGLQSEGGPMEFRNVYLVPITE